MDKRMLTILAPCQDPDCEDGLVWVGRRGGNDPDVRQARCWECGGSGYIEMEAEEEEVEEESTECD